MRKLLLAIQDMEAAQAALPLDWSVAPVFPAGGNHNHNHPKKGGK